MAREVTSRMNRIIELLITSKCRNLKEIADVLGITLRQVRYDIDRINSNFVNDHILMIETDNKGLIIINDMEKLKKFHLAQEKEFKCSREQRIILLTNVIAFDIEALNLNEISKKVNVTRVTIKNDLNEVKSILSKYNLKLVYINRFYLIGDAEDIFEFRLNVLRSIEYSLYKDHFEKIENLITEYITKVFPNRRLREIIPIITNFVKANNILIKDSDLYWLIINILLVLWYIYMGIEIPNDKHRNVTVLPFDYSELFSGLEDFIGVAISNDNRIKIMKIISSVSNQDILETENFNRKVVQYIFNLIKRFPEKYRNIFISDGMLLSGLYAHLNCCLKKIDALVDIAEINVYPIELDESLNEIIETYCNEEIEIINLSNDKDKELLKLHFASSLYRHNCNMTKRVMLISGASKFAKKRLKMVLESLFEVSIKDVISKYEIPFYEDWQDIDIILFTESIPKYFNKNIPMARIKLILDNDDISILNKLEIYPKERSIDLHELYLELNFLKHDDQIAVIDVVSKFLEEHMVVIKNKLKSMADYTAKIVNNIDLDKSYIQLDDRIIVLFQKTDYNCVEVMVDRNVDSGVIKIKANSPVSLLFILFDCYKKFSEDGAFTLSDDKIISLLHR